MIKANGIKKSFGSLEVLKGVNLEIGKSEVVSIMGASGAGKSTLLQILGTLSTPDSGSLIIDGVDTLPFLVTDVFPALVEGIGLHDRPPPSTVGVVIHLLLLI